MEHKGTKIIETDNLILREFQMSDAKSMYKNWGSDSAVTKYLTWDSMSEVDDARKILQTWTEQYKYDNFYQWAIVLKTDENPLIGSISVVNEDEEIGMVEIGYCIGRNWWNKGITSEALDALIGFFMNEVKVNRIQARHDPVNENSGKVMKKCNMQYEGTMRKADKNNQGICDVSIYAILAEDYIEY